MFTVGILGSCPKQGPEKLSYGTGKPRAGKNWTGKKKRKPRFLEPKT